MVHAAAGAGAADEHERVGVEAVAAAAWAAVVEP